MDSLVPELTVALASLIIVIIAGLLRKLDQRIAPRKTVQCFSDGCTVTDPKQLNVCPRCGNWFCPAHKHPEKPRFCASCKPNVIDYVKMNVRSEARESLRDHAVQLAGIGLAALAIIFSIGSPKPDPSLVTSFSLAIFLFLLTYIIVGYFESYGAFLMADMFYIAGIEILIVGVVAFAYPNTVRFTYLGINLGITLLGVASAVAVMLLIITFMRIVDIWSMTRG